MNETAVASAAIAGSVAHDLTVWGLFLQADLVVKIVMIMLVLASVWCWAIIFEKLLKMKRLMRQAEEFEEGFWSGGSLEDLYDRIGDRPTHPMASIFTAAMREWRRSASRGLSDVAAKAGLAQRIERVMHVTLGREMDGLEKNMTFLASVGSTAPFIGLFGTVWGIMNSFQAIAQSKDTSLAVVAPGIAEALFATALGLVAAIPAVVAYNKISTDLGRYAARLESFSNEFTAILSRQFEENG
jgi:biopolymer transport protein TolQ